MFQTACFIKLVLFETYLFANLDFSPKKLHIFRIFQSYHWLKDITHCISLEPQEQADFMHTTTTWILDIHEIIYRWWSKMSKIAALQPSLRGGAGIIMGLCPGGCPPSFVGLQSITWIHNSNCHSYRYCTNFFYVSILQSRKKQENKDVIHWIIKHNTKKRTAERSLGIEVQFNSQRL